MGRVIACVCLLAAAAVSQAADYRFMNAASPEPGSGDGAWTNAANWRNQISGTYTNVPGSADRAIFSRGGQVAAIVSNAAPDVGRISLGQDEGNTGLIMDAGSLAAVGTGWSALGYNRVCSAQILNGSSLSFGGALYLGYSDGKDDHLMSVLVEDSTLDVAGTLSMGLNFDGSHSTSVQFDIRNSTVTLAGLSISGAAHTNAVINMDISNATVIVSNDVTALTDVWQGDGRLTAHGGDTNWSVAATWDGTVTTLVETNAPFNSGPVVDLAEEYRFHNTGLWSDLANWRSKTNGGSWNIPALALPSTNDVVKLNWSGQKATVPGGFTAYARQLQVGVDEGNTGLTINGGSVIVVSPNETSFLGYNKNCTMAITNAGSLVVYNNVHMGWSTWGEDQLTTFDMDSGSFVVSNQLQIGRVNFDGTNQLYISFHGGAVDVGDLVIVAPTSSVTELIVDIESATITVGENVTSDVASWVSDGLLTAYGGAGTIVADYDVTTPGKTTITATNAVFGGYDGWAAGFGGPGVIGTETNDYDLDLLSNVHEYGVGGDPTDPSDAGNLKTFGHSGGVFVYVHPQRSDDPNLVYTVETTLSLSPVSWSDAGHTVVSTNVTGGLFDYVTNTIPAAADETFVRLKVENP